LPTFFYIICKVMYQAISYNYYTKKTIIRDDKKGWVEVDYKPTYYKLDKEGEFFTIDGRRVSPTQNCDKTRPHEYFEIDVPIETNALVDIYKDSDDAPKWHNIVYLDIECEIGGALTTEYIQRAPMKITSIALYDVTLKKYYCLILDEKKQLKHIEENNKEIIPYNTEKELLKGFLNKWEECDPTIISGWNSEFFDMPYLYHRMCNVVGDQHAKRLSPLKRVQVKSFVNKKTGSDESSVKIEGVNHLDYMLLHKKFIMKQEPSYKLDAIGEKYAKINKIEYEGSLDDLFKNDVNKFIEYNLRDVEILVALDNKLQFIALTQNICHLCHTTYENIYYSTALNEGAILTYLRRENIVSPNKPTTYNQALKAGNEEYAGGYLKDPVPGLYEWVSDLDFTSLYPSIIRNLNMGIETLVCRIKNRDKYDNQWGLNKLKELDPDKTLQIERVDLQRRVQTIEMSVQQVIDFVESKNMMIAANGTIFRTDKDSIVAKVLDDWFAKRKQYKNEMKKAYKAGDAELGEFYNKRQHAFKIKLNDVYGCFAQNGWRYSDGNLFISKAITLTGQFLDQESISFVNKEINSELGTDKDYVVTADTDSLFFEMKDLIKKRRPDVDIKSREEVVPVALEITAEYQEKTKPFLQNLCKTQFNCDNVYFELKQEVVLERGYFAGKRRYAQFIVNKEGVPVEELDIKGMDIMKSNMTPMYAKFGESLIMDIMYGKPKKEIDKKIQDFRKKLKTISYREIAKPSGVKKIREYIASPPSSGQMFSKLGLKCPINTKASIFYNDLLRFKKLDKEYSCITEGDKIKFIPLKKNPYNIPVLAFTNESPQFIFDFLEKYADTDSGFNNVLLNKLEGIYDDIWGPHSFPSLNEHTSKFFNF
jgi:DNA polymerase elongation subunit (family B)